MSNASLPAAAVLALLTLLLTGIFFLSFFLGDVAIGPAKVLDIFLSAFVFSPQAYQDRLATVVLHIRLPRILAAMLVGAALSASGAAYQGIFRNPMASPGVLGVSAGAGCGAALAILLSWDMGGIQAAAFIGGLLAVGITYSISLWLGRNGDGMLIMILAGMIVGTVFTSLISCFKFMADSGGKLPAITFWLMGSLASVTAAQVTAALFPIGAGVAILLLLRWKLNLLSFGDEEAAAMGVQTGQIRGIVVFCATMITASAVAIGGMIALVGLVVPHLARLLVGPNFHVLLPASVLLGASFLLAVDDAARTLYAVEIPIGILTSMIGSPLFLFLLMKMRRKK